MSDEKIDFPVSTRRMLIRSSYIWVVIVNAVLCLFVSAAHFAPYLAGLSSMMLI